MTEEIIRMMKDLVGPGNFLYFSTAVKIKMTPHSPELNVWALGTIGNVLQVRDERNQWQRIDADITIGAAASLYQRVKLIWTAWKKDRRHHI